MPITTIAMRRHQPTGATQGALKWKYFRACWPAGRSNAP